MRFLSSLLLLAPHVAFRRAARKHLIASSLANQQAQVWQRTLALQTDLQKQRPQHSLGVNHFLRFMEWDHALYRAALEHGLPQEQASRLIEEINWEVFGSGIGASFALSRLRSAKLQTRIQWVLDLLFFVLFTKPFRKQTVPSDNSIAFDVVRCPVAEYFQQQGVPELTRVAACNLDHRMAKIWGVKLERSQTIAAGEARCDFRFKITPSEQERTK
jgi:hypothetical protein